MGIISRGIKNAFRNTIRSFSIVFILALSIAMSLIMLLALKTVQAKISSVKESIGNIITVSPAGVRGFEGGGTLLTSSDLSTISSISGVNKITGVIEDRMDSTTTNLQSPITPGAFGGRQQNQNARQYGSDESAPNRPTESTGQARTFSMPITATASSDLSNLSSLGVSQFAVTSGTIFDSNSTENIALVGKDMATKNNLAVDGTFTAYSTTIKVVGIYDTGNTFTNGGVIMPIKTLQTLSGQTDQFNSLIVQTNSIDNLSSVQTGIKDKLGSDKVDVVTQEDTSKQALAPLENIKTISLYSLIGSLVAGAIIIFLTMIMIVRERRREIGVLKAIGSSNINIVSQFITEALSLTLLASIVGSILGFIFSNPVLKVLVTNSESATATNAVREVGRGMGGGMMARIGGGLNNTRDTLANIHAVVGWDILLYGLLAAVIIAIIGSAIPALIIAKVRPAEVMRAE